MFKNSWSPQEIFLDPGSLIDVVDSRRFNRWFGIGSSGASLVGVRSQYNHKRTTPKLVILQNWAKTIKKARLFWRNMGLGTIQHNLFSSYIYLRTQNAATFLMSIPGPSMVEIFERNLFEYQKLLCGRECSRWNLNSLIISYFLFVFPERVGP